MYAEDILKDYGAFMEEHDNKLQLLSKQLLNNNPQHDRYSVNMYAVAPPIEISCVDVEYTTWHRLRLTEAELLANKPLTTLAHLCNQCKELSKSTQQLQLKYLNIDELLEQLRLQLGNALEPTLHHMSTAIDFFCQLYFLLKRIIDVLQNMWSQITAYISVTVEVNELQLFTVFDAMIELIEQLVVFNELTEHSNISTQWAFYRKWLQSLAKSKEAACNSFELNGLQTSLEDIETVITGQIFRIFLDSLLESKKHLQLKDASVNSLTQHGNAYIRKLLNNIEWQDYKHYEQPKQLLQLTAFICMLYKLGVQLEGKLLKQALETLSKYQRLPLSLQVHWTPHAFIHQHAKTLVKPQDKSPEPSKQQLVLLDKLNQSDMKTCRQLGTQLTLWCISMQRALATGVFGQLKSFARLLLQGQSYVAHINSLIAGLIRRHVALAQPLGNDNLWLICKLLQFLQQMQQTFAMNQMHCTRYLNSLLQWQKQKIQQLLLQTKRNMSDLKQMQRKLQILTMLKLTERAIRGQANGEHLGTVKLALSEFLGKERPLSADKQKLFKSLATRTDNLCRLQQPMQTQLDATALIYFYATLGCNAATLKTHVKQQRSAFLLHNFMAACNKLDKNLSVFQCAVAPAGAALSSQRIYETQREFLSTHLEFLLRMEALSHLFLEQEHPFQTQTKDYRNCIKLAPIERAGEYYILRNDLENYFTATFYNLTTIAPHDWKSYERMRHLANKLLQLRPVDDYLPNQIIDQGIDVLQIMRNIHTFVSSFAYNMNLQLFVEIQSSNKHLDIVGARHVANSVQTHGTGIINTTVNFIYQFLRQKFYTFSTFLHDEHIKSRLLKEFRYHAEHKHDSSYQSYPYERAESFIKKIRKLGVARSGETYMDLFRKVVTQIGNAVGYVRLLQAGSKNANFRSRSYMSRSNNSFERAEDNNLDELTESAIKAYEKSIGHLKECYSDRTNYFKLLLQGFQPFFCNPHNNHLRTFYLIAPALIINYIENRVKDKLQMHKKTQAKCVLFEDGFAIGLIYILNMLKQLNEFHELNWSQTTTQRLEAQRLKLQEFVASNDQKSSPSKAAADSEEKLLQTMAITERHVNAYEQEYNLLYATLSSAEIFFQ
ncbi:WASH complex subunit 4 isoform X2 [Drosophila busckii]|nr:WASH complex subunit 4 isoform X2 [Drosophila busckii]